LVEFSEDLFQLFGLRVEERGLSGGVVVAEVLDLSQEIAGEAVLAGGKGTVKVREGATDIADEAGAGLRKQRREFESLSYVDDASEGFVETVSYVVGHSLVQTSEFILDVLEILGDGIADVNAGAGRKATVEALQAFLVRTAVETDEAIGDFVGTIAVEASHPELGGGVGQEGNLPAGIEDGPSAADNTAERFEEGFEEIHRAIRGFFIGELRWYENLQVFG
jgi:hypothetical protein